MAVSYIRQVSSSFGNSLEINPTLSAVQATAGDRIVVVYITRPANTVSSVAWGGQALTEVVPKTQYVTGFVEACYSIFSVVASSTGTQDITSSTPGFYATTAIALVFSGVHATTPFGTIHTQEVSSPYVNPSLSITGVGADDLVVSILGAMGWDAGYATAPSAAIFTPGAGQTTAVNVNNTANFGVTNTYTSYKNGSGTVPVSYTVDTSEPMFAFIGFRLIAAGGGGASVDSYPSTTRSGSTGNAYATTGLSSVSGITIDSLAATSISDTSGDGTHSVPSLADGVAHELYGTRTVTITGAGGSPTTTTNFQPLSTQNYITLSGTLNTTNTGVLYNLSPAAVVGDQIVFLTASNTSVDAQGNLATDLAGTQQMWHIQASTKVARSYDVTTGESTGITVSITGVAGTGAVGTVTPTLGSTGLTVAITGVAGTGTVGTVVPSLGSGADITVAISGVAGTGTVGTVTPVLGATTLTVGITGVSGTGTVGTVTTTLTDYIVRVSTDLPKFIVSVAKSIRRSFKKSFRKK